MVLVSTSFEFFSFNFSEELSRENKIILSRKLYLNYNLRLSRYF